MNESCLRGHSYYLALVNPVDPRHKLAVDLAENLLGCTFVTEYVLVELGSASSRGSDRLVYLELLERLQSESATTIIPAGELLFRQGVALFGKRPDKEEAVYLLRGGAHALGHYHPINALANSLSPFGRRDVAEKLPLNAQLKESERRFRDQG